MKNNTSQSAKAHDGYTGTPVPTPKNEFHGNGNPPALGGVKESRNTGIKGKGTAYLRSKQ